MDAITEQEAPVTLIEAEEVITTWQTALRDAQNALASYEKQLGLFALVGAQQELTRLQSEVAIAEQACIAAHAQREVARRWVNALALSARESAERQSHTIGG